jgi:hypothetical protein
MLIFTLTKNIYDISVNTDSDVIGDDASCNSPVTNWCMCYTGVMMAIF